MSIKVDTFHAVSSYTKIFLRKDTQIRMLEVAGYTLRGCAVSWVGQTPVAAALKAFKDLEQLIRPPM